MCPRVYDVVGVVCVAWLCVCLGSCLVDCVYDCVCLFVWSARVRVCVFRLCLFLRCLRGCMFVCFCLCVCVCNLVCMCWSVCGGVMIFECS